MPKITKAEADYVAASTTPNERCRGCSMFRAPTGCSAVRGRISPEGRCRLWEAAVRKDLSPGDVHVTSALGGSKPPKKRGARDFLAFIGAPRNGVKLLLPQQRGPAANAEDGPELTTVKRTARAPNLAASVLFCDPEGRVLLLRRSGADDSWPGHWSFPGGKVDDGETAEEGARREAAEEVGADRTDRAMTEMNRTITPHGWEHTTFFQPVVEPFDVTLSGEHDEHAWVGQRLPEPLHPAVAATIAAHRGEMAKRYASTEDLPEPVRDRLKGKERRRWMRVFNASIDRHGDEGRAFAAAWATSRKAFRSATLSGEPMIGVGGRRLEPFDGETYLVPMKHDPVALSYLRQDQVPRFLDALTHPDRLSTRLFNIADLTTIKPRVSRSTIEKHLKRLSRRPGRIDAPPGESAEGVDDLAPVSVIFMNGALYLCDGHERTCAIWLDGGDVVMARYDNIDAFNDTKPDPDDAHEASAYELLRGADGRQLTNYRNGALAVPFFYDASFFSRLRPDQVPKFIAAVTHPDDLPREELPLADLIAIQDRVNADTVAAKVERPTKKLPVVVRMNGVNYIGDGHDRLTARWLSGDDAAPVRVADVTFEDNGMKPAAMAKRGEVILDIAKVEPTKRQVFGWMSICTKQGSMVLDRQGDVLPPWVLEPAVYEYVLESRIGGDMHVRKGVSRLIESCFLDYEKQAAMGIDPPLDCEGWWVGYYVDDDGLWDDIKSGRRPMFSIGGAALSKDLDEYIRERKTE